MTVFVFGEPMLEFHGDGGEVLRYGGDTLNTAIHLARDGHDVGYVAALGMDAISDVMIAAGQAAGIDTRFVLRRPMRNPGIYAIHIDESPERSILYWRDQSAARAMLERPKIAVVVDSSGAGDAFNAGFLSAKLKGHALKDTISSGQPLARQVIGNRSALPAEALRAFA